MEEEASRVVKEGERLFWAVFGGEKKEKKDAEETAGEEEEQAEEKGFFVPAVEMPEGEEEED